jgi:hypothetical protein
MTPPRTSQPRGNEGPASTIPAPASPKIKTDPMRPKRSLAWMRINTHPESARAMKKPLKIDRRHVRPAGESINAQYFIF